MVLCSPARPITLTSPECVLGIRCLRHHQILRFAEPFRMKQTQKNTLTRVFLCLLPVWDFIRTIV
jgi:hypothetical protein